MQFNVSSEISKFLQDFDRHEQKNVRKATRIVKAQIKSNIKKNLNQKTGNLMEGVYHENKGYATFVGIRAPAFHNFLIEFGHRVVRGKKDVGEAEEHPVVYPAFEQSADRVQRVISEPMP